MICIAKGNQIIGICHKELEIDIKPYRYVDINKIDLYETPKEIMDIICRKTEGKIIEVDGVNYVYRKGSCDSCCINGIDNFDLISKMCWEKCVPKCLCFEITN